LPAQSTLERADVTPILRPPDRPLVHDEIVTTNEGDWYSADVRHHASWPRCREVEPREGLEEVDASGDPTHPDDLVRRGRSELGDEVWWDTESEQRRGRALDVFRGAVEPQVEVLRRPRAGVQRHGVAADHQVANSGVAERRKHLDQIEGQAHRDDAISRG
jgi:hypothetical protein